MHLVEEGDDFLTPREAARLFRVNVRTLRRWTETGVLRRSTTPGGHSRYRRSDVEALLKKGDGDGDAA